MSGRAVARAASADPVVDGADRGGNSVERVSAHGISIDGHSPATYSLLYGFFREGPEGEEERVERLAGRERRRQDA